VECHTFFWGAMLSGIFFEISSFRNRPSLRVRGIKGIVN
jgi:hypothetical protein